MFWYILVQPTCLLVGEYEIICGSFVYNSLKLLGLMGISGMSDHAVYNLYFGQFCQVVLSDSSVR